MNQINQSNGAIGTSGGGRRSKRTNPAITPVPVKQLKTAASRIRYCTEWFLPWNLCCSGCVDYVDLFSLINKDDHEDPTLALATASREQNKDKKYQCRQPWKIDGSKELSLMKKKWIAAVKTHFSTMTSNIDRLINVTSPHRLSLVSPPDTAEQEEVATTPEEEITEEQDEGKEEATPFDIKRLHEYVFESGHKVRLPNTHTVVLKSHLGRCKNDWKSVSYLRNSFGKLKFQGSGGDVGRLTQTLLVTAFASCPALPLFAAAYVIPVVTGAFLLPSGILDYKKFDLRLFTASFPLETWYRDSMFEVASRNTLELGYDLVGKVEHMSCDKGNKKGISHFVKYLHYWCAVQGMFMAILLDGDGSDGTSPASAKAIQYSLKKVSFSFNGGFRLYGKSTDSGNGGVLDGLERELRKLDLCAPPEKYLVAACSIHTLQLALSNPTKQLLGKGGVGKKNLIQMLHSSRDMQDCLKPLEWKAIAVDAKAFELKWSKADDGYNGGDTKNGEMFADSFNKVLEFRLVLEVEVDTGSDIANDIPETLDKGEEPEPEEEEEDDEELHTWTNKIPPLTLLGGE